MRFYPGQPVVCVEDAAYFKIDVPDYIRMLPVWPQRGERYVVEDYTNQPNTVSGKHCMWLVEFPEVSGTRVAYAENAFAPITDNQVKTIMQQALKARSKNEKVETN